MPNFDDMSHAYSWNWGKLHLIQVHRFSGDSEYASSSFEWLKADLATNARNNRPVVLFQHYGFDDFSIRDEWWTDAQRNSFKDAITGYNVVGIFTGHAHWAQNMVWEDGRWADKKKFQIFQVDDVGPDEETGVTGSFAIVHMTDSYLDMVTCKYTFDASNPENPPQMNLVGPSYAHKFQ